ncbi:hypothetical protein BD769DRAFT_1673025 [Suillus cothurnatus]|nr:hypothetical protein BD769DRAFT_1673025 [Suillus cothurnatus]
MFAIKSPDIILKATVSHPPTYELANAMSEITTTLLGHSLPRIRDSWFPNNCWKTVDLPTRLQRNATMTDTTSNNISDVEWIALKLNDGTKELTSVETHPGVYARDTTGTCSTSLDALALVNWPKVVGCLKFIMARRNTSKVKKIHPQLTTCQKAAHCAKFIALTDDVNGARTTYMDQVQVLAKKHGCSERWTQRQLYLGGQTVQHSWRPNAWNAFVCQRLDDINEETLRNDYARLSHAQKNNYEVEIIKMRADKQRMVCNNPRAVQRDMQATFAAMDQEGGQLFAPASVCEGFYVSVRGGIEDLSGPKLFFSEKAEKFHLALKLEAFAVSGLAEDIPTISTEKKSLNQLVSECRTLIQDELDFILRENKLATTQNELY